MNSEMEMFVVLCKVMGDLRADDGAEDLAPPGAEYDPHYYGTPEDIPVRYRVSAFGQTFFFDADGRYLGFLISQLLPGWVGRGEPSP